MAPFIHITQLILSFMKIFHFFYFSLPLCLPLSFSRSLTLPPLDMMLFLTFRLLNRFLFCKIRLSETCFFPFLKEKSFKFFSYLLHKIRNSFVKITILSRITMSVCKIEKRPTSWEILLETSKFIIQYCKTFFKIL